MSFSCCGSAALINSLPKKLFLSLKIPKPLETPPIKIFLRTESPTVVAIVIQDCVVVVIIPTEPNANPAAKIYFFIIIFLREVFKYQAKVTLFFGRVFLSFAFPMPKNPALFAAIPR